MLAEKFDDIGSDNEIDSDDYIPSNDDGDLYENVPPSDVIDEEADYQQNLTKRTLAPHENPQMSFAQKKIH